MRPDRKLPYRFSSRVQPAVRRRYRRASFPGIVHILRSETEPRSLHIHIVKVDLAAPGIRFQVDLALGGARNRSSDHARFSEAGTGTDRRERALLRPVPLARHGSEPGRVRGVDGQRVLVVRGSRAVLRHSGPVRPR